MTICFKDFPQMKKFFAKCMFSGDCADNTLPKFDKISSITGYKQVVVESGEMDVFQLGMFLKENKIGFLWVNEY